MYKKILKFWLWGTFLSCNFSDSPISTESCDSYDIQIKYPIEDTGTFSGQMTPFISGDFVFYVEKSALVKANLKKDEIVWKTPYNGQRHSGSILNRIGDELLLNNKDKLVSYDMDTGEKTFELELENIISLHSAESFSVRDNLISSGDQYGKIFILNWDTKKFIFEKQLFLPEGVVGNRVKITQTVLVNDSLIAIGSTEVIKIAGESNSRYLCINYLTGEIIWEYRILSGTDNEFWGVEGELVLTDSKLINFTNDRLICFDVFTGNILWERKGYLNGFGTGPFLINDYIYIATNLGLISKIDYKNGNTVWEYQIERNYSFVTDPISGANGKIFGSTIGALEIYDEQTGERLDSLIEKMRSKLSQGVASGVATSGEYLALIDYGIGCYVFKCSD